MLAQTISPNSMIDPPCLRCWVSSKGSVCPRSHSESRDEPRRVANQSADEVMVQLPLAVDPRLESRSSGAIHRCSFHQGFGPPRFDLVQQRRGSFLGWLSAPKLLKRDPQSPFEHCVTATALLPHKVSMKMVTNGPAVTTCCALITMFLFSEANWHPDHQRFTVGSLGE